MAEKEFGRVYRRARGRDDSLVPTADDPDRALRRLRRTGRILVAAGALSEEVVDRVGREIEAPFTVRCM